MEGYRKKSSEALLLVLLSDMTALFASLEWGTVMVLKAPGERLRQGYEGRNNLYGERVYSSQNRGK